MSATVTKTVRVAPELWERLSAESGRRGMKLNAFIVAQLERAVDGGEGGADARPDPAPKGPVPAMELRPKAAGKVKAGAPKVEAARAAMAQAEVSAAHLAQPKPQGGRVNAAAAMDKAGLAGWGERPAYGSRLKGAAKPAAPRRR